MTKIDIFSGFLGAGKTTLIKKLIKEAYAGEQIVLIENEFGEIGIDGGFMQEAGIQVNEMNSGCICCSLVGDFGKALEEVIGQYHPNRILIEPSGVGKLSDVIAAVMRVVGEDVTLGSAVTVVDANKCKVYLKNFGEFYSNQVEHADAIILSRTDAVAEEKLNTAMELLRKENGRAVIITTPWPQLNGVQILEAIEHRHTLEQELAEMQEHLHGHDHCCHEEHQHDHDHCCHEEHHHGHGHHHHHADEVFQSWGVETHRKFSGEQLRQILAALEQEERFGTVLRAKGIVQSTEESWLHFDFVPGDFEVRSGSASVTGRLCVIGAGLKEDALRALFEV